MKDFNVENRFGEIIVGENWGTVPYALYVYQKNLNLSNSEVWLLCWIFMHQWTENDSYPSLNALARYSGRCRNHIQKITKSLTEKGLINKKKRNSDNGATASNFYDLSPLREKLEKEIMDDPKSNYSSNQRERTNTNEAQATRVAAYRG